MRLKTHRKLRSLRLPNRFPSRRPFSGEGRPTRVRPQIRQRLNPSPGAFPWLRTEPQGRCRNALSATLPTFPTLSTTAASRGKRRLSEALLPSDPRIVAWPVAPSPPDAATSSTLSAFSTSSTVSALCSEPCNGEPVFPFHPPGASRHAKRRRCHRRYRTETTCSATSPANRRRAFPADATRLAGYVVYV